MPKPKPEPVDPAEVPELAKATIADARFPQLATIDGDQPRVRPVSPVRTDGFTIYVANLRGYHKTGEIRKNPNVELCYMDSHHNQVRITGVAEVIEDRALQPFVIRGFHDGALFRGKLVEQLIGPLRQVAFGVGQVAG